MKKLVLLVAAVGIAATALAVMYAAGKGAIAVGDNVGYFGAAAGSDGVRGKGGGRFFEVTPDNQIVASIWLVRSTSVMFDAGTCTISGPGVLWTPAGAENVTVTMVLTDSSEGDSFSVTAGTYSASGPLIRGEIIIGEQ
jgi:hypothetical protein